MKARWKIAVGGLALILVAVVAVLSMRPRPEESSLAAPEHPLPVRLHVVRAGTVPGTISVSGTVKPFRTAAIATRVTGLITRLSVEEGDRVRAGEPLVHIDVSAVAAQAAQAEASVALAQAARGEREQGVGQAQAALRAAQARITGIRAQLLEARAQEAQALTDQRRYDFLFRNDAVARADLDRANTALSVARARIAVLDAALSQARADLGQAEAALGQARASVGQSDAAVQVARAGVDVASSDLAYGVLRAPFDGVVTRKQAEVGDLAAPGRPLLRIDEVGHLRIEAWAPEDALRYVRIGQRVPVEVLGTEHAGRLTAIVPSADPETRTFLLKVSLQPAADVIPGVYGRVLLRHGERSTVRVPAEALVRRGQLVGVFTVSEGRAQLRWIKTGANNEVLSGLATGERIVMSPPADLEDGQRVQSHD